MGPKTECKPRCMISKTRNLAHAIAICFVFYFVPNYGQQDSTNNIQPDSTITAQEDSLLTELELYAELVRKAYGLDQTLLNGVRYFNVNELQMENPYFLRDDVLERTLILNGQIYHDVDLEFDIYSQHLELNYPNFYGGISRIFTVADHVDGFSIGLNHFEKLDFEKGVPKFYQVIRTNCFTCYILWQGTITGSSSISATSGVKVTLFLELDIDIKEFDRKSDFSKFFAEEYRKEIKQFLRKNSFTFRTATPEEMIQNLNDVCNLLEDKQTL